MVSFLSEFRRDGWEFSRFEGFLRIAFGVHAGTWLVGSWATRASWLPAAATWLVKVENIAKMVTRWYVFIGIQKGRLEFSRFEGFLRVAFAVHAGAWLVGS